MKVQNILKAKKNAEVLTVQPDYTILKLVQFLQLEGVGAMVVSRDGRSFEGIISERDVVHALAADGTKILASPVSAFMTTAVVTCSPDDSVAVVARMMTEHHVRHVPVINGEKRLVGIISIGDVLKHRIDEVQFEANVLRDIAIAGR
jgi:CBS domain-containing protein